MLKNIFYDLPDVFVEGWALNYTNYWSEEDEDHFFCSGSFINSFMSWIFFFWVLLLTFVITICMIGIAVGIVHASRELRIPYCMVLNQIGFSAYQLFKKESIIYLAGTPIDHLFRK